MKKKMIFSVVGWILLFLLSQGVGMLFFSVTYFLKNPEKIYQPLDVNINNCLGYIEQHIMIVLLISYVFIALIAFIFMKTSNHNAKKYFKIDFKLIKNQSSLFFITLFISGMMLNLIISFIVSLFNIDTSSTGNILFSGNKILIYIVVCVCGPLVEEFIFRNRIYNNLLMINFLFAFISQAVLFGLSHGNLVQGIYTTISACIFMLVDIAYDSLIPSITMHMGLNFFAFLIAYTNQTVLVVITFCLFVLMVLEVKKITVNVLNVTRKLFLKS